MKGKLKIVFVIMCLIFSLTACSDEEFVEITMPHNDYYYETSWSVEDAVAHFEELGFNSVKTETRTADTDDFNIIFDVEIDGKSFASGDVFKSTDNVNIIVNDRTVGLTKETCGDLEVLLIDDGISYMAFAEEYDGEFIEFEATVTESNGYLGDTSHIVEVCDASYEPGSVLGHIIRVDIDLAIDDRYIDEYTEVGDKVKVVGKIDAGYSEYYEKLYIEAVYFMGE